MRKKQLHADILKTINEFGWAIIEAESTYNKPAFAYTVGLSKKFGWPEMICLGVEPSAMLSPLNAAINELRDLGLVPQPGLILKRVAVDLPCLLGCVTRQRALQYAPLAYKFAKADHESRSIEVLQLIWPDRYGRFPHDNRCLPEIKNAQPLLSV